MEEIDQRQVFISYSHENENTKDLALSLATTLNHYQYVKVVLDRWYLTVGDDKFDFMEESVYDSDFVLILCDAAYQYKSDHSEDTGVKHEKRLITPSVFNQTKQSKFVPIVLERDKDNQECVPRYLKTRMYIDMSDELLFDEKVEEILRIIYEKPKDEIPISDGILPDFMREDSKEGVKDIYLSLKHANDKIDKAIDSNPRRIKRYSTEFKDEFFNILDHQIILYKDLEAEQDKPSYVYQRILDTECLKEEYVKYITLLNEGGELEAEVVINFIEEFHDYLYPSKEKYDNNTFNELQFEHFKFLMHEIFLYATILLMDDKKYNEVNRLTKHEYNINPYNDRLKTFAKIRPYLHSLEASHIKEQRASVHTDLLLNRAGKKWRQPIIETDMLLYFISKFQDSDYGDFNLWFPMVSLYEIEPRKKNKYIEDLKYKDYFDKVKLLFDVGSSEEFVAKNNALSWDDKARTFVKIPSIATYISISDINTK